MGIIELSIVTGTYNRLLYFRRMVESVWWSIGKGLPYEIIAVDGGSTDGTIDWALRSGIRLIKHGKLLGAVKAFNDGARAARGRYVILANDDIQFVDESILAAYAFMQDNPDTGIGCFYQDRRGWKWHVETMPAILDGKQISTYYGQVCIVPRWLGDKVGWWGNYLRTYGGDNELSCNVLEAGYTIKPIPCACIHDSTPADELRAANNTPTNGNHPDTQKWLDKWTKDDGKRGPIINLKPKYRDTLSRRTRVLYAPIYEPGFEIQKRTKNGLRRALSKFTSVIEVDYVERSSGAVFDIASAYKPDIFILQLHGVKEFDAPTIRELKRENPKSLFVNWNGDYHPEHLYNDAYIDMLKEFHLSGFVTTEVRPVYDKAGVRWFYWQIGYEEFDDTPLADTPKHEILFLGNGYSKERHTLAAILQKYNAGIYGIGYPRNIKTYGNTVYDFDAGARLYANCKIAIGDSQWPRATGFVSNRLFQAMAAGACFLQQSFDGMEELLGLKSGYHLYTWDTLEELEKMINFLLKHDLERRHIARNGRKFILNNHSFEVRVIELLAELGL